MLFVVLDTRKGVCCLDGVPGVVASHHSTAVFCFLPLNLPHYFPTFSSTATVGLDLFGSSAHFANNTRTRQMWKLLRCCLN